MSPYSARHCPQGLEVPERTEKITIAHGTHWGGRGSENRNKSMCDVSKKIKQNPKLGYGIVKHKQIWEGFLNMVNFKSRLGEKVIKLCISVWEETSGLREKLMHYSHAGMPGMYRTQVSSVAEPLEEPAVCQYGRQRRLGNMVRTWSLSWVREKPTTRIHQTSLAALIRWSVNAQVVARGIS